VPLPSLFPQRESARECVRVAASRGTEGNRRGFNRSNSPRFKIGLSSWALPTFLIRGRDFRALAYVQKISALSSTCLHCTSLATHDPRPTDLLATLSFFAGLDDNNSPPAISRAAEYLLSIICLLALLAGHRVFHRSFAISTFARSNRRWLLRLRLKVATNLFWKG
jgi:hypothetical protein